MNQPHLINHASGIPTFVRVPYAPDSSALDAEVVVIGFPTDDGSFGEDGARFGPRAIRRASMRFPALRGYWDDRTQQRFLHREMTNNRIVDAGDFARLYTNAAGTFEIYRETMRRVLAAGALPIVLGGDQAVTVAVLEAFATPLQVLHFSAHVHSAASSAAPFTANQAFTQVRARTAAKVVAHIGVRGFRNPKAQIAAAREAGEMVITPAQLRRDGFRSILDALDPAVPVYVSMNIDAYDISIARGCATPEPAGLLAEEVRDALTALAEGFAIAGFDVVEVNPLLDARSQNTAFAAAQTALEFLARICVQPRWLAQREPATA